MSAAEVGQTAVVPDPETGHPAGLEEGHGRWILPVAGCEVSQVQIDYAIGW